MILPSSVGIENLMVQRRALDGIRVVDFSWVRAGPWATRWLGALGAEIIKIEWPETERGRLPSSRANVSIWRWTRLKPSSPSYCPP